MRIRRRHHRTSRLWFAVVQACVRLSQPRMIQCHRLTGSYVARQHCRKLRISIARGDLAATAADALITPANDSLVGNLDPMYWR